MSPSQSHRPWTGKAIKLIRERKADGAKGKGGQGQKAHSFKWSNFPSELMDEGNLVKFRNEITDHAFDFAQPAHDPETQESLRLIIVS